MPHIPAPDEQPGNRNVFVDVFPVETHTAQFDALPLSGGRMKQAWKPVQWDGSVRPSLRSTHIVFSSKRTAVGETLTIDPRSVVMPALVAGIHVFRFWPRRPRKT